MMKEALKELGDPSSQELAEYIERQFGIKVEARFIPIWMASLRGQQALEQSKKAVRLAGTGGSPVSDH